MPVDVVRSAGSQSVGSPGMMVLDVNHMQSGRAVKVSLACQLDSRHFSMSLPRLPPFREGGCVIQPCPSEPTAKISVTITRRAMAEGGGSIRGTCQRPAGMLSVRLISGGQRRVPRTPRARGCPVAPPTRPASAISPAAS